MPEFRVGPPPSPPEIVSISALDGQRLVGALSRRPPAVAAAARIERAMELGTSTTVQLLIGEDEAVLEALAVLRAEGEFGTALERLDRALRTKILRER
jgi:hypothetical protein